MTTTTDTAPQEDATRDDAAVAAFEALLTGFADSQTAEKTGDRTPAEADPEGEDEAQAEDEETNPL